MTRHQAAARSSGKPLKPFKAWVVMNDDGRVRERMYRTRRDAAAYLKMQHLDGFWPNAVIHRVTVTPAPRVKP